MAPETNDTPLTDAATPAELALARLWLKGQADRLELVAGLLEAVADREDAALEELKAIHEKLPPGTLNYPVEQREHAEAIRAVATSLRERAI